MEKITLENIDEVVSKKTGSCPDCGSDELKVVFVAGDKTGLFQNSKILGMSSISYFSGIKAIMCTKCRLIIKQFADKS